MGYKGVTIFFCLWKLDTSVSQACLIIFSPLATLKGTEGAMIHFSNNEAREFLLNYAKNHSDQRTINLVNEGVKNSNDVVYLAKTYWDIVDSAKEQDIERLLERLYTSLHIHCGNEGFDEVWENSIPK